MSYQPSGSVIPRNSSLACAAIQPHGAISTTSGAAAITSSIVTRNDGVRAVPNTSCPPANAIISGTQCPPTYTGCNHSKNATRGCSRFSWAAAAISCCSAPSRLPTASRLFADPQNVAPHVAKILRIQAQHFRPRIEFRQRARQIVRRRRADVAQILRYNQIRRQRLQRFRVHGVHALPARDVLPHLPVNFERPGILINARMNHDGLGPCARREVALVAHAHNFAVESQREQDFRGRRQEGYNSHARNLPQSNAGGYKAAGLVVLRPVAQPFLAVLLRIDRTIVATDREQR